MFGLIEQTEAKVLSLWLGLLLLLLLLLLFDLLLLLLASGGSGGSGSGGRSTDVVDQVIDVATAEDTGEGGGPEGSNGDVGCLEDGRDLLRLQPHTVNTRKGERAMLRVR